MSSLHVEHGKTLQPSSGFASSTSQPQFAHGGNGSCSNAQPEPAARLESRQPHGADALVMLQLASFEGRAL